MIHPIFHVSLLKKKLGTNVVSVINLPSLNDDGQLKVYPKAILQKELYKKDQASGVKVLMKWNNLGPANATWEDLYELQQQLPEFHL